jgi:hypothetical protein
MPNVARAGAFVRRKGAEGLGHLGWSFQYPEGKTGFWSERIADPASPLPLLSYDAFKMFEVPNSDAGRADSAVAWVAQQPYLAIFRNCLDATYDVLRSYGVQGLPLPTLEITPNRWFDSQNRIRSRFSHCWKLDCYRVFESRLTSRRLRLIHWRHSGECLGPRNGKLFTTIYSAPP